MTNRNLRHFDNNNPSTLQEINHMAYKIISNDYQLEILKIIDKRNPPNDHIINIYFTYKNDAGNKFV